MYVLVFEQSFMVDSAVMSVLGAVLPKALVNLWVGYMYVNMC